MKNKSNEQNSDSYTTKESDIIYPFCVSLVSSTLKELQRDWIKQINNNKIKKDMIQLLFSLLNYQILLIQQISKYYNLYIFNLDEDNMKLINQIININKELMNKKIKSIINYNLNQKENNNTINEAKILDYKISKCNDKKNNNKHLHIKDNYINYIKESSFRDKKNKIKQIKIKNNPKRIIYYDLNKNKQDQIIKIKEIKNNNKSNVMTKNIKSEINKNKLYLKKLEINNNFKSSILNFKKKPEQLKRSKTENFGKLYSSSNYCKTKMLESSNNNRIKINLAEKFLKNNENSEFATLSNISRHSKKSLNKNIFCLIQSTFNNKKQENTFTLPLEENPVRKVKNIILNAKNSNFLFIKTNTPKNICILNKQRYSAFNKNRNYFLFDEINKIYDKNLNNIVQSKNKNIFSLSNSTKNFYKKKNYHNEIKKSMSNKNFLNLEIDNINLKVKNKERECNQILKDGMKNIEKRLNSKPKDKKVLYKNKSNDCLTFKKIN